MELKFVKDFYFYHFSHTVYITYIDWKPLLRTDLRHMQVFFFFNDPFEVEFPLFLLGTLRTLLK